MSLDSSCPNVRNCISPSFPRASLVAQTVKASAYNAGDPGSIPGSGRSPGERNGDPFQYSCLESPRDRGDWGATVYGVAKESDMTERLTPSISFLLLLQTSCFLKNIVLSSWESSVLQYLNNSSVSCCCLHGWRVDTYIYNDKAKKLIWQNPNVIWIKAPWCMKLLGKPAMSSSYTVQVVNDVMFCVCGFLFSETSEEEVGNLRLLP